MQHDAEQRIEALRRVFDAVPDAVLVIDEAAQPQWRNAAFEQTFGITRAAGLASTLNRMPLPERTWQVLDLPDQFGNYQSFNSHCSRILIREGVAWRVFVLRLANKATELHP